MLGAGVLSGRRRRAVRPYNMRITRDHGGGLWTVEDSDGQLYLAVLSKANTKHRRSMIEQARARGGAHYWPNVGECAPPPPNVA